MMLHLLGGKYGSHVPLDLLWQVILGVTDQFLRYRITEHAYEEYCWNLKVSGSCNSRMDSSLSSL